jgi:hypothetical protein
LIGEFFKAKVEGEGKTRMSSTRTEIKGKKNQTARTKELNRNNDFSLILEKNKCEKYSKKLPF